MWSAKLEVLEIIMVKKEPLWIANFPSYMVIKGIGDVPQVQLEKAVGVPQKLIQKAIWKSGLDATITAKKIKVGKFFLTHLLTNVYC